MKVCMYVWVKWHKFDYLEMLCLNAAYDWQTDRQMGRQTDRQTGSLTDNRQQTEQLLGHASKLFH